MPEVSTNLFRWEDVEAQIGNCNFKKAIGPDGFNGHILHKNKEIRRRVCEEVALYLNAGRFPEYLKEGRLIPLSKRKGYDSVETDDIRPLVVESHLKKLIKKTVRAKINETKSKILSTGTY